MALAVLTVLLRLDIPAVLEVPEVMDMAAPAVLPGWEISTLLIRPVCPLGKDAKDRPIR
jgi:hypothetical protein